jgi:hypothetical protein
VNPEPFIVIVVFAEPATTLPGTMLVMIGAAGPLTLNRSAKVAALVPPGPTTVTSSVTSAVRSAAGTLIVSFESLIMVGVNE